LDLVRCIATARIVMPRTVVRLSAGRLDLSSAEQALAFMAGANSIFDGDKLLTTPNNDRCATLYAWG
jgi:biotin synthase